MPRMCFATCNKILASALFIFIFHYHATAQTYKRFKLGAGMGYFNAFSGPDKSGLVMYLEPSYLITQQLSVGFRFEGTSPIFNLGDLFSNDPHLFKNSWSLTSNYYFAGSEDFLFFAGGSVGVYSISFERPDGSYDPTALFKQEVTIGLGPRIGFQAAHFVAMAEYNAVMGMQAADETINKSYISIKFGFFLFGGIKRQL